MFVLNLGKVAPAVAPYAGLLTIVAAVQGESSSSGSSSGEIWRIVMTGCLTIFVTLVGVIYSNINKRIDELEKDLVISRKETSEKLEKAATRQSQLFGLVLSVVLGPNMPSDEVKKLVRVLVSPES